MADSEDQELGKVQIREEPFRSELREKLVPRRVDKVASERMKAWWAKRKAARTLSVEVPVGSLDGPERIGDFLWQAMPDGEAKYQAYLCSREWAVKKEAVHKRCGGACERCHLNPVAAVHHLTYERKYEERLEDLAGWCRGCHEFTHGKSDKDPIAEYRRWVGEVLSVPRPLEIRPGLYKGNCYSGERTVVCCPFCNCENCHMKHSQWSEGNQGYLVVRMSCEGNHEWEMVFEGHKGTLTAWVQNGEQLGWGEGSGA